MRGDRKLEEKRGTRVVEGINDDVRKHSNPAHK